MGSKWGGSMGESMNSLGGVIVTLVLLFLWVLMWVVPMAYYANISRKIPDTWASMHARDNALDKVFELMDSKWVSYPRRVISVLAIGCILSAMYTAIKTNFTTILL